MQLAGQINFFWYVNKTFLLAMFKSQTQNGLAFVLLRYPSKHYEKARGRLLEQDVATSAVVRYQQQFRPT